jgi:hypothetical protein
VTPTQALQRYILQPLDTKLAPGGGSAQFIVHHLIHALDVDHLRLALDTQNKQTGSTLLQVGDRLTSRLQALDRFSVKLRFTSAPRPSTPPDMCSAA